jgi:hypothetical protein
VEKIFKLVHEENCRGRKERGESVLFFYHLSTHPLIFMKKHTFGTYLLVQSFQVLEHINFINHLLCDSYRMVE